MNPHTKRLSLAVILATGWLIGITAMRGADSNSTSQSNKQVIQASFDRWRAGTGGPFELLTADATWTITGNSIVARKYATRDDFMDTVIKPFNARLSKPLVPTIRNLYADGETIIALFDAEAMASDGTPYRNTYAWFMKMKEGKIVEVTAFFDALEFDGFWKRVKPRANP